MAKLGPRKDKIADSIRKVQLSWPYLGKLNLSGVSYDTIEYTGTDGEEVSYKKLFIRFNLHGDMDRPGGRTQNGTEYSHQVYAFNDQTTLDVAKETIDHLYYILEYFFGEETADKLIDFDHDESIGDSALPAEFDAWATKFATAVTAALNDPEKGKKITSVVRKTKIGGYVSVKSGRKPRTYLRWPTSFMGWLAKVDEPLEFEGNEIRNNAKYVNFMEGNTEGDVSNVSSSGAADDDLAELTF